MRAPLHEASDLTGSNSLHCWANAIRKDVDQMRNVLLSWSPAQTCVLIHMGNRPGHILLFSQQHAEEVSPFIRQHYMWDLQKRCLYCQEYHNPEE